MSIGATDPLERLIRHAGEEWLIENYPTPEQSLPHLGSLIAQVGRQASQRWGQAAPRIDLNWMTQEQERNPHKVQAFLQALGATESPDMLLMVWGILEGWEIQNVHMEYTIQKSFRLRVTLRSNLGNGQEIFESTSIDDAALLHHFGIMTMGDAPIFDGFYPLKLD
jgi:hypothetical protein